MRHIAVGIATLVGIWGGDAQAQKVFAGIEPTIFSKRWSLNEWHVWALPAGTCLALSQDPGTTPFQFWGVRQSPGSRVEFVFGSIDSARPRTVQMSFNNGGRFDYEAKVVRISDWNAYSISLQANALSVFHDTMVIESFVGGERVFLGVSNSIRHLEKAMRQCLEWQQKH